jgi:cytochrome c oxidase assembly factor 5
MSTETKVLTRDKRPCSGLRVDLKICLLQSECCRDRKKTPLVCLQEGDVSQECQALRTAFFECKRSILDMRTRFRGRKGY